MAHNHEKKATKSRWAVEQTTQKWACSWSPESGMKIGGNLWGEVGAMSYNFSVVVTSLVAVVDFFRPAMVISVQL